jgi:hypothetical protein
MARMLVLVLLSLVVCEGVNAAGPAKRKVLSDELKDAFDEIDLGMPDKLALAKIGQPAVTSGDGASFPDWRWYKFSEWFANGNRIEIRFRHGRVIQKLYESQ